MTQQTGVQLKPLLNLQMSSADFTQIEKTFQDYTDKVKASIPVAAEVVQSSNAIGSAAEDEAVHVQKSTQVQGAHSESLRGGRRSAIEAFGAISFLIQGIVQLASANDQGNKQLEKLSQGMAQGISTGFGLAGILTALGIATGGVAVGVGAVVTVGVALLKFFDDTAAKEKAAQDAMNGFSNQIRGASIDSLKEYNKNLTQVIGTIKAKIAADEEQMRVMSQDTVNGARVLDELKQLKQALGVYVETQKTVNAQIDGIQKNRQENDRMITEATIAGITSQYAKERALADQAMQDDINSGYSVEAARAKHREKMKEIDDQELKERIDAALQIKDQELKISDDLFEAELNKTKAAAIQRGAGEAAVDQQMISARKERFQNQLNELSKIAGPLSPEQAQKQAELEKQITDLEVQEAEKRKAIKQSEEDSIAKIQDLALATTIEKIKVAGAEQNATKRKIEADVLAAEKKGKDDELKTLTDEEAQGKQLDRKQLERKAQLQNDLTKLDAEGVEARRQLALQDAQATVDSTQTIADNLASIFPQIKAFSIAATLISTYSAAQKAYEAEVGVPVIGPGLALAAAATAIAMGLAKVASIAGITGFADGGMATGPTLAMVGDAGPEIMAPEKSFIQVFKDDLGPKLMDVLALQIKASVLANDAAAHRVRDAGEEPSAAHAGEVFQNQHNPSSANTKATGPTLAMVGDAGPEIMAPEKSFIQVFKDDPEPKLMDVLAPQIKASVLANASVAANGQISGPGAISITITMEVAQFIGTQEFFNQVIKPAVEDAMRGAGTKMADSLFVNRKYI